tara:strand:+ start:604 stop:711 length:108 start_codon:yes stop_codon:yes gene_type:complete
MQRVLLHALHGISAIRLNRILHLWLGNGLEWRLRE